MGENAQIQKPAWEVFIDFIELEHKSKISNYEDISIENSVLGQLNLGGFSVIAEKQAAECHREMIFGTLKDQRGSRGRDA